jgi:hypothetical protein
MIFISFFFKKNKRVCYKNKCPKMSLRDYEKKGFTLCYKHFDLNRSLSLH